MSCFFYVPSMHDTDVTYRRELQRAVAKTKATEYGDLQIMQRRTALLRAITIWTASQAIFMPEVAHARASGNFDFKPPPSTLREFLLCPSCASKANSSGSLAPTPPVVWAAEGQLAPSAEEIPLCLPSDIPTIQRERVCLHNVAELERQYRLAEIEDHLVTVRRGLRLFAVQRSNYKGEMSAGTKDGTRARTEIHSYIPKANHAAALYRIARSALLLLDPDEEWQKNFRVLLTADIRGPYALDHDGPLKATGSKRARLTGGGHAETSWIWTVTLACEDKSEQMRAQYSTLKAHAERYEEELLLLPEEMRRTLASFDWERSEWIKRATARSVANREQLTASLTAYAFRQASLRENRIRHFAKTWLPLLAEDKTVVYDWTNQYEHLVDAAAYSKRATTVKRKAKGTGRGLGMVSRAFTVHLTLVLLIIITVSE
jgi:hypothetical protein